MQLVHTRGTLQHLGRILQVLLGFNDKRSTTELVRIQCRENVWLCRHAWFLGSQSLPGTASLCRYPYECSRCVPGGLAGLCAGLWRWREPSRERLRGRARQVREGRTVFEAMDINRS